jgi:cell pole-organizing protein PopZ
MTDPVSSMDVEDVLSSIRRLVSEEAKGNGPEGGSGDLIAPDIHEAAENAADDALADIVQQVEDGGLDNEGAPPSNELVGGRAENDENPGLPPVSFRHQAASAARRAEDQKLVLTAAFRVADQDEESVAASDEPTDEIATDPAPEATESPDVLHLRPVVGEAANDPSSGRTMPFESASEDTLFDRARRAMDAVGDTAHSGATPLRPVETPVETEAEDHWEEAPEDVDEFDETAPTLEPVSDDEDLEDDVVKADASPFRAGGGVFGSPAPAQNEADEQSADDEPSTINFAEDESILDEETLRDMVSEMVREELRGELGDRITRNVRKLVRREIQRALASREFE